VRVCDLDAARYRIPMFSEAVIAEAARRLSAAAPGAKVILFGSHARGDAGRRSDLDFLVVESQVEDAVAESVRLRRTLRGLGVFADVIVVSDKDVEEWRDVRGSLIHAALADGRAIAA
jgi:predicted nucleotidyltransferase